jgi:hypothetical protein
MQFLKYPLASSCSIGRQRTHVILILAIDTASTSKTKLISSYQFLNTVQLLRRVQYYKLISTPTWPAKTKWQHTKT